MTIFASKSDTMSDGNFNRALLPSTPYGSGLRMGQQQMRSRAIEAFTVWAKEKFPTLSDEELSEWVADFRHRLASV